MGPVHASSIGGLHLNGTSSSLPGTLIGFTCVQLDEYYPYKEELKMLGVHAERIVDFIPRGAILVELGCGSATKTSTLLNAMLNRYACPGVRQSIAVCDVASPTSLQVSPQRMISYTEVACCLIVRNNASRPAE
jgi:hypothetical protein